MKPAPETPVLGIIVLAALWCLALFWVPLAILIAWLL
jgi:hypothetical protein